MAAGRRRDGGARGGGRAWHGRRRGTTERSGMGMVRGTARCTVGDSKAEQGIAVRAGATRRASRRCEKKGFGGECENRILP